LSTASSAVLHCGIARYGSRICTREHGAERRSRALIQDDSGDLSKAVVFEFQTAEGVTSRSRDEFRPSFVSRASLELKAGAGECRALAATHGPRAVKKARGRNHRFSQNIRHSLRDHQGGMAGSKSYISEKRKQIGLRRGSTLHRLANTRFFAMSAA
jgi:hypothetical protein